MLERADFQKAWQKALQINLANIITTLRFPLLILVVVLLYQERSTVRLTAASLVVVLILMDTLDGLVARRRHEETLLGSALDIATDRAVEIVLWVVYAHLGLIAIAIPLVVIIRGTLTDSVRSVAAQHGMSAHGMMRSSVGAWLVASPPMRTSYGITKFVAFVALTLALAFPEGSAPWSDAVYQLGVIAAWLATAICILRGLPVLWEAPSLFRDVTGEG